MEKKFLRLFWAGSKYPFAAAFLLCIFNAAFALNAVPSQQVKSVKEVYVEVGFDQAKLSDVFNKLESLTDFSFVYDKKDSYLTQSFSVKTQRLTMEELLLMISRETGLTFRQVNNNISVLQRQMRKDETPLEIIIQTQVITGRITDFETGEPLPGVNILEKGSVKGTVSDIEGRYSLTVSAGATLVFSYIGYVAEEVAVGSQSVIDVAMMADIKTLEEIVVVGYGTMKKKDLTGSIIQVRPENMTNENPKTVQDILRGTPGLNVGYNASAKGGGVMRIRGQRSVYDGGGHNDPLLILDGMLFYGELSEINPDDIEQIDVLKDASAAAIYGAKAANGVIIITTKTGKQGKPVINFNTNVGWTQRSEFRERFTPEAYLKHRQDWYEKNTYGVNPATGEYEAYQSGVYAGRPGFFMRPDQLPEGVSLDDWRAYTTNGEDESDLSIWARRLGFQGNALENLLAGKTVDWTDRAFRLGFNQDYNTSISGAGEKVDYYLSMGYLKNQGAVKSDDYQSVRANMKMNAKVNDWFQVGANVNFQNRSDGNIDIDLDQTMRNSPYADYVDDMGNPLQYPLSSEYSQRGYNYDFQKQYLELEKGFTVLNAILNAKVKLPFNITYSFNASPRYQFFFDRYFMSADLPGSDPKDRGVNREQAKRFDWSLNNNITWDHTFNNKHHVILTLVQEAEERQYWSDRIEARNIQPSDALGFHNTKNGGKADSNFRSSDERETGDALLARLFYSYDERYMITTSIRRDGYSAFGSSNPYATFPSVSAAWSFANEDFFKWKNVMNSGKLRFSFGKNGNRALGNPYLALANLYEGAGKMQGYITPNGDLELLRYLMADRMANPHLQWEKTESWNIGLDFGFFNNRLSGSVEYYNMTTHDMIMEQRLPDFTGFPKITTNLGQVDNNGFEVLLRSVNIDQPNIMWNTTFGFSYNKNVIRHLYYNYEDIIDSEGNVIGKKEADDINNGWFIGQPISAIWAFKVTGIWQKDELEEAAKYGQVPGDPKVENSYTDDDEVRPDGSVRPVYNNNDKQFLGQTTPPVHWSLRNEFVLWKDLSVSFNIYSYMGHKSLSSDYLNNDDDGGRMAYALANLPAKSYWTVDNPTNKYGRIEAKGPVGAEAAGMLYDRSFIRLENISVGYTLPKRWTSGYGLEPVKIYGSVRNVGVWSHDWEYGDPETGSWASRVFTLGLNLVF